MLWLAKFGATYVIFQVIFWREVIKGEQEMNKSNSTIFVVSLSKTRLLKLK